jgi:hypothetical protein
LSYKWSHQQFEHYIKVSYIMLGHKGSLEILHLSKHTSIFIQNLKTVCMWIMSFICYRTFTFPSNVGLLTPLTTQVWVHIHPLFGYTPSVGSLKQHHQNTPLFHDIVITTSDTRNWWIHRLWYHCWVYNTSVIWYTHFNIHFFIGFVRATELCNR